jgi:F-type H+-transporting ATPase subunit gamma
MELVAATKMRKAEEAALSSRRYAFAALEILANLTQALKQSEDFKNIKYKSAFPLLAGRPVKTSLILAVTSDKGLAGSFNGMVLRKLEDYLGGRGYKKFGDARNIKFAVVGQKGADYIKKRGGQIEKKFVKFGDVMNLPEIEELADFLRRGYEARLWDEVLAVSANFVSALRQEAVLRQLLPVSFLKIRRTVEEIVPKTGRYSEIKKQIISKRVEKPIEYIIEPSPREALGQLIPLLFKMQIYHIILEANASEHSARRVAMKNASDNASDLIGELTLLYNRSRQELITKEITEIASTMAAIK